MKKIIVTALAASLAFFASSCQEEELEPTNIEKNWAENIDFSNSYVQQLYDQTGVAILTEFDDTLDVFYQGAEYGTLNNMSITHITDDSEKVKAIEWLKTNVLDCFSSECIKNYFPRRLFICKSIRANGESSYLGSWIRELKYTGNCYGATGAQHAFPFAQGMAICVNVDELLNTASAIDYRTRYRNDIMTLICHELFMKNDWLEGIENDMDIFPDEVTRMYGLTVLDTRTYSTIDNTYNITAKGMYRIKYGCSPKDATRGDVVTRNDWSKMSLEGYFKFGFPDNGQNDNKINTDYFSWPTGTPKTYSSYMHDGYNAAGGWKYLKYTCDGYATISNYSQNAKNLQAPLGQSRDARDLINAIIDLNATKLTLYGNLLIGRLTAMSEYLKEYGIDFEKFNPVVTDMYEMN